MFFLPEGFFFCFFLRAFNFTWNCYPGLALLGQVLPTAVSDVFLFGNTFSPEGFTWLPLQGSQLGNVVSTLPSAFVFLSQPLVCPLLPQVASVGLAALLLWFGLRSSGFLSNFS